MLLGGLGALVDRAAIDERHRCRTSRLNIGTGAWRLLDRQVFMARAALPALQRAGCGAIVNMGSCWWRIPRLQQLPDAAVEDDTHELIAAAPHPPV